MILNLKNVKMLMSCFLVSGLLAIALPGSAQPSKGAPKDAKVDAKPVDSDGDGVIDDKDGCPKQKGDTTCLGCPCKPTSVSLAKFPEFVAPAEKPDPNNAPAPTKGKKGKGKGRKAAAVPEPTFDENFIKALNDLIALAPEKFVAQQGAPIGKTIPASMWEANVALPTLGAEPVDHRVETVIRDGAHDVVCRVRTTWRLSRR